MAVLHDRWSKVDGGDEVKAEALKAYKSVLEEVIDVGGEDGGKIRPDEVPGLLGEGVVWREMGDAATTAGFHVLAACIFETGVEATGGSKGYIWRR